MSWADHVSNNKFQETMEHFLHDIRKFSFAFSRARNEEMRKFDSHMPDQKQEKEKKERIPYPVRLSESMAKPIWREGEKTKSFDSYKEP